jgi:hypothetical protein
VFHAVERMEQAVEQVMLLFLLIEIEFIECCSTCSTVFRTYDARAHMSRAHMCMFGSGTVEQPKPLISLTSAVLFPPWLQQTWNTQPLTFGVTSKSFGSGSGSQMRQGAAAKCQALCGLFHD